MHNPLKHYNHIIINNVLQNRIRLFDSRKKFCSLTKAITPKICRLCFCPKKYFLIFFLTFLFGSWKMGWERDGVVVVSFFFFFFFAGWV